MKAQRLALNLRFLFRAYLSGLLLFFIYRLAYTLNVLSGEEIRTFPGDLFKAFVTGIRFDTVTICYGLVLPVLLSFFCVAGENAARRIFRIQLIYLTALFVVFLMVLVVDYYYYTYFQSHINVLIFGFMDDDTAAVAESLWTDYPLVRVILGIISGGFIFYWLLKRMHNRMVRKGYSLSAKASVAVCAFLLALFAIGLRSSFGTFPVQMDDASVSGNARINLLPINGVFAFKDAIVYHKNEFNMAHVMKSVANLGYGDRQKALQDFLETNFIIPVSGLDPLYTRTDSNSLVRQSPPNVVFFLLESWSNNNMYLHSKDLNLLGKLEEHWNSDVVFRHFLAGHNGTINSIEGMMINTPVTPVAQSAYSAVTFESSCAKPFYQKGYSTTFISGGKINWRNINNFIPRQYFEHVEGNADIAKAVPGTKECEWGVYDEYLFDGVFKKLKEAGGKPQFIFALTTTNHTPFHLPGHYKPYPVVIPGDIKEQLKVDEEMAISNLTSLQYTNDCLGRFLEQLDNSPFAENTIVVATGDHNNLMLFDLGDSRLCSRLSVPLLIHAPGKYFYKSEIDTTRWGAHKDIFPTIYHLALDSAVYFNNGNNLLERNAERKKFFALNIMGSAAINDDGGVRYHPNQKYFGWKGDLFEDVAQPDSALTALMHRSKAYYSMMAWHLKEEVERKHNNSFLVPVR
jgi:phosphoglycerol transferase MdoB-like AlkP superfamily enzyme